MEDPPTILAVTDAKVLIERVLSKAGFTPKDAAIISAHLIRSELRGHPSHGLRRLPGIVATAEKLSNNDANSVLRSAGAFTLFDGSKRLGIAAAQDAIETACASAQQSGLAAFGLVNYYGTTGSLGLYSSYASEQNCVSVLVCSSEYAVAPSGSKRAILGTNPIAVGFPGSSVSFLADMATAAWSYGAILEAADRQLRIPEGIVQTIDGEPSTDPNDADNGSQLPMAGHKGYGLGLAIELLCGPLLGGKAGRDAVSGTDGMFGVVLKVDIARTTEAVFSDVSALFDEIKSAPAIGGADIRIPGEHSAARERSADTITVSKSLLEKIAALGERDAADQRDAGQSE